MEVFLYAALGLLVLYFFLRRDTGKHKQIPGIKGWPLVGYALNMKKGKEHEIYSEKAEQYGDIFKLNMLGQTVIVLNTAEMIRAAFSGEKYKKHMNDRAATFFGEYFLWGSQSIAFMHKSYGSDHSALRKTFSKGMHVYGEGKKEFEDRIKSELGNLVNILQTREGKDFGMLAILRRSLTNVMSIIINMIYHPYSQEWGDSVSISFTDSSKHLAANIFLNGHDLKDDDKDVNMFWEFIQGNDFFLGSGVNFIMIKFPFIRFLPGVYKNMYERTQAAKQMIIKRYFHDIKATYKPGEIRGIMDFLIGEQLEAQKDGPNILLTDVKIKAMVLETIAGGILTSLGSLSNLFLCLLNNPVYQVKIQAELDKVIGTARLPTLADKQECVFLEAAIIEAQRYITTVPLSIPHLCIEGKEFEGYEIPANSVIIPNVWYVHHDEKIWGDPWNFRPERWLDVSGDLLPNDHILRKNWLAFSTGRRQCPGESLARSRIFLYVATLLQRWNLEFPPGHSVPCDPRLGHYNIDLNCRAKPYMCRVTPRSKTPASN